MRCDYFGCSREVCDRDKNTLTEKRSLKFCQGHSDELKRYIESGNAKAILAFWIKSYGGPKKLAETF